jgi:hypothetical protein
MKRARSLRETVIWGEDEWHERVLTAALVEHEPFGAPPDGRPLAAALAADEPLGAVELQRLKAWIEGKLAPRRDTRVRGLTAEDLKAVVGGALIRTPRVLHWDVAGEHEEAWEEARRAVRTCRAALRSSAERQGLVFEKKRGEVLALVDELVRSVDAARLPQPDRWHVRYRTGGRPLRLFGGTVRYSTSKGQGSRGGTGLRAWVEDQLEAKLDAPRARTLARAIVKAVTAEHGPSSNATSARRRAKSR